MEASSNTQKASSMKFKRRVYNVITSLGVMGSVSVTHTEDYSHIYIESEYAMTPDLHLKYSEQYNVYHVYIHMKCRGQEEKWTNGYSIAVVDSSLAAADIVHVVETLYRRRAGRKNNAG